MPRGYTMVWSGWDKSAGTSTANFNATITLPIAKNPDGSSITGPAYEYIVIVGDVVHAELSGGHAGQGGGHADTSRSPQRHAGRDSGFGMGVQRASGTAIRLLPAGNAIRRERHLRVLVHGQGSDGERAGLRRRSGLERMAAVRREG